MPPPLIPRGGGANRGRNTYRRGGGLARGTTTMCNKNGPPGPHYAASGRGPQQQQRQRGRGARGGASGGPAPDADGVHYQGASGGSQPAARGNFRGGSRGGAQGGQQGTFHTPQPEELNRSWEATRDAPSQPTEPNHCEYFNSGDEPEEANR